MKAGFKSHCAVIAFHNTPSGMFEWWDEFPQMISKQLVSHRVDFIPFYRCYEQTSKFPFAEQRPIPPNALGNRTWLRDNVESIAARYDRVIFHTHSYYHPNRIWIETVLRRRRWWFVTEHRIGSTSPSSWKRAVRVAGRLLGVMPHRIFGVSNVATDRVRSLYGHSNVKTIHNGIRLPDCLPSARPPKHPSRGLYVGRLDPKKGIWPLVNAYTELRKRRVNAELDIVGGGPIELELREFVAEQKLEGTVRIHGHQCDPKSFYESADFIVIPTIIEEALSLVSLEARVHRLPAVYANSGGLIETRTHEVNGLKLDEVSPTAIADAIEHLGADPIRYKNMSQACTIGLEYFSIERMVNQYVQEYLDQLGIAA
jgi:glycosyltransferase involved in cell wall biosynthesis